MALMKVAMVSEHASPLAVLGGQDAGGQNVHVAALARALAGRGNTVEVYTRRDDADMPMVVPLHADSVSGGTAHVVHVPAGPARYLDKDHLLPYMPRFGAWLARHWTWHRPDLVHAHFWMSGVAALWARDWVGVPVVQTFHALGVVKRRHQRDRDTSPAERIGTERRLARDSDAIIATCSDEVRELLALGAPPERLHIAPCGVDFDAFRPDGPAAPRTGVPRIVSVGRLVERKGIDVLLAALARLPGAELVVAGGPDGARPDTDPEVRRLRAVSAALGVANRVRLIGRVARPDVPALLRSADVVACTPWYEPFGIVPLEAMACGVPVVVTAVGGMLDTVLDGQTGLHVPANDPGRLATALSGLFADPDRRAAMGRRGVKRVRSGYGWDDVAAGTEAVYREVVRNLSDAVTTGGAGPAGEVAAAAGKGSR
ncbi:MAG TPA: glycosyltransferase [Mycobacteriales bacterium]|nr:glycosyltransferase [Mycobacteriales bacterium]